MEYLSVKKRFVKNLGFILTILVTIVIAIKWGQWHNYVISIPVNDEKIMLVNEPIKPIPLNLELDGRKVELGEKLFRDPILSGDNKVACISCHSFNNGGVDGKALSIGVNGEIGTINTLTVFNSGFNFRLNWDGKYKDLFEQLDGPLLNPKVMGSNWVDVLDKLQRIPTYRQEFARIYPDGITEDNVKDVLGTFQESLYTPNSRFDRFLRGDSQALTESEKQGYNVFKAYGCVSCHQGMNVGGNIFQKFGVIGDYFADRGNITPADWGRFNVTGDEKDRYVFRVPSLRNVVLTAPYFHDGSAATLEEAIAVMAKYQLGRPISSDKIESLIEFLKTLTGEYQGKPL